MWYSFRWSTAGLEHLHDLPAAYCFFGVVFEHYFELSVEFFALGDGLNGDAALNYQSSRLFFLFIRHI